MIIGNGLIATSLKNIDSDEMLFFASGVSNSLETRSSEFEREFTLLRNALENNLNSKFIYFSTLSINDQSKQDSHYVLHKKEIENYIQKKSDNYLILRIGNIVGRGGNPNTLFNYLKTQISNNNKFALHTKARRLLIDIDDIAQFLNVSCSQIKNETINFAYPYYYDLSEIINAIQLKMDKKANYDEVNQGDFYKVTFEENITAFFSKTSAEDYIKILTEKYI